MEDYQYKFQNFTPIHPNSFFDRLKNEFGCHIEEKKDSDSIIRVVIQRATGGKTNIDHVAFTPKSRQAHLKAHLVRRVCRSLAIDYKLFGISD